MSSIKHNAIWMVFGRLVFAASQWVVIVCIARFLGASEVGSFSYAMAFCAPIFILFQMNMRMYLTTDVKDEFNIVSYLQARAILSVLAILVCTLLFVVANNTLTTLFLAVVFFKAVESNSDIFYGYNQKKEAMKKVGVSLIFRGAFSALSAICGALYYKEVDSVAGLMLIGWSFVLIFYDARNVLIENRYKFSGASIRNAKEIVRKCWPLGLVMSLGAINVNAPVYIVEYYLGDESVGIYSSIAYFFFVGRLVTDAVAHAAAPRLSKNFHGNKRAFHRMFSYMIAMALLLALSGVAISWFVGGLLLSMIYGGVFSGGHELFVWIMAAAGVSYLSQVFSVSLTVARKFFDMLLINIVCFVVALTSSMILIDLYGIDGAGMALFCTMLSVLLFNVFFFLRRIYWGNAPSCRA